MTITEERARKEKQERSSFIGADSIAWVSIYIYIYIYAEKFTAADDSSMMNHGVQQKNVVSTRYPFQKIYLCIYNKFISYDKT